MYAATCRVLLIGEARHFSVHHVPCHMANMPVQGWEEESVMKMRGYSLEEDGRDVQHRRVEEVISLITILILVHPVNPFNCSK